MPATTCPHVEVCGGCTALAVPLAVQLQRKQERLVELARALGFETDVSLRASEPSTFHRTKAIWPLRTLSGRVVSGFYRKGTHDLVDVEHCLTQDPAVTSAQIVVREAVQRLGLTTWDEGQERGFARAAFARLATGTSQMQVGLVTTGGPFPESRAFVRDVRQGLEGARTMRGRRIQVTSIVRNLHDEPGNRLLGRRTVPLAGPDYLEERLGRLALHLRMTSFFQVNPYAAIPLYRSLLHLIEPLSSRRSLECFAGVGTISLWCRARLGEVYTIEQEASAVRDARENFERNGLATSGVLQGRVEERLADVPDPLDLVILDPPRVGLDASVRHALVARAPRAIAYVSCSEATFSRDAQAFLEGGYRLAHLEGHDFFPHTDHLELLALFRRD